MSGDDGTNPLPDDIAKRQEVVDRMGARAAFEWFKAQTAIPGTPTWQHQEPEPFAKGLLTDADFEAWDRHWPAPRGAAQHDA